MAGPSPAMEIILTLPCLVEAAAEQDTLFAGWTFSSTTGTRHRLVLDSQHFPNASKTAWYRSMKLSPSASCVRTSGETSDA